LRYGKPLLSHPEVCPRHGVGDENPVSSSFDPAASAAGIATPKSYSTVGKLWKAGNMKDIYIWIYNL
jgi:hypothetical protein